MNYTQLVVQGISGVINLEVTCPKCEDNVDISDLYQDEAGNVLCNRCIDDAVEEENERLAAEKEEARYDHLWAVMKDTSWIDGIVVEVWGSEDGAIASAKSLGRHYVKPIRIYPAARP